MQEHREVIIAGSGPAGALTAALLAGKGHDVLLNDKESFLRDKVCGDAVSGRVLDILEGAGMKEIISAALEEGSFYPISGLNLTSPAGHLLGVRDGSDSRGYNAVGCL